MPENVKPQKEKERLQKKEKKPQNKNVKDEFWQEDVQDNNFN